MKNQNLQSIVLTSVLILSLISCNSKSSVKIGEQEWSSKNLDVSTFRNGDSILEVKSYEEFANIYKKGEPAWCYYDFDKSNGNKYGKLYNHSAINDTRGLTPDGWHIPTGDEVEHLYYYLGYLGAEESGIKLKSKDGWSENENGSNISGFNGLPGGYAIWTGFNPEFKDIGVIGIWYCYSSYQYFYLYSKSNQALLANQPNDIFWSMQITFCSVRCIKNK